MSDEQRQVELNDRQIAFLTQEADRLQTLYSEARAGTQSVFNFYLTFATTVVGGVIVLLQVVPLNSGSLSEVILTGLLFFAVVVGSVYLSALSGRYGHMARYANGIDAIRAYLIHELSVPVLPVYEGFMKVQRDIEPRHLGRFFWLIPSGTYQLFIVLMNSFCLAGMVWLLFGFGGAVFEQRIIGAVIVFMLSFFVHNAYSHIMIVMLTRSLNVRIDVGDNLKIWAGRDG